MGKKTRKTRWRTLAIADESDSEESNTLSGSQLPKSYHHRPFYSKFPYSSQSTPTRRFPYEPKSTRSSSTASETKITFNEDEYTKITTPRQDVLFKKGYLNKPKNYQTQTSTGNSTASTGNSTGNGTPDHQSADGTEGTDLEYESQFVFPNAFVDQNGIYYINSYEHYPLVMYNPTICYPEYPLSRTKRHSTGSLTESTSPHTEETSQDLSQSGGENTGNGPDFNHVYNVVYPGYYFNGVCSPNVTTNGQAATEPRKIKKKRRRKISKSVNQDGSSSSEDGYSSDEAITQVENRVLIAKCTASTCNGLSTIKTCSRLDETGTEISEIEEKPIQDEKENGLENCSEESNENIHENNSIPSPNVQETDDKSTDQKVVRTEEDTQDKPAENLSDQIGEDISRKNLNDDVLKLDEATEGKAEPIEVFQDSNEDIKDEDNVKNSEQPIKESKFNLNAEEFVPRAYRNVESIPVDPNLQFINIHPNFVPLPLMNHPELNAPPFNPPFLPPGIPLNFMPADPKLLPNFINFVPNRFVPPKTYEPPASSTKPTTEECKNKDEQENAKQTELKTEDAKEVQEDAEKQEKKEKELVEAEKPNPVVYKTDVDIAKIVSKLEEAAKEQKFFENKRPNFRSPNKFDKTPRQRYNSPYEKTYQIEYKSDRQHFDKRRSRRFETKPNEHVEVRQKETSTPKEETIDNSKILQNKSEEIQTDLQIKTDTKEIISKSIEDERKFSPRHLNYKNPNSPRKYINYNNRNTKGRTPENTYSVPTSNYSDTLKKSSSLSKSCPRYEKHASDRPIAKSMPIKKIEESAKETVKAVTSNKTSQWISVSNRKKRKNKSNTEDDTENVNDILSEPSEEVFVEMNMQLNEKILENKEDAKTMQEEQKENLSTSENLSINKVDSFIEMVSNREASPIKVCSTDSLNVQVVLQDVKDIEKELLKESIKIEIQKDIAKDIPDLTQSESLQTQSNAPKEIAKKKAKKGNAKNMAKRIIILDPDISKEECMKKDKTKPKTDVQKSVKEETKPKDTVKEPLAEETQIDLTKPVESLINISLVESISSQNEEIPDDSLIAPFEITIENASTPDKKKAKKKKKQIKPIIVTSIPSVSSSSTTLNNIDDSYDFLLDTTALVDDKTNIEVSEELDKMIQKGLFGNLEEKFKSLNVSVDDDFFKSLSLKPKTQATPEKGFIKATNFTTILNNTNQSLPKANSFDDQNKIDIDFSKIKLPDYEPQPSTSRSGSFLEEASLEVEPAPQIPIETTLNTKSNGKLKNKSKKNIPSPEVETKHEIASTATENTKIEENADIQFDNENIVLKNGDDVTKDEIAFDEVLPKNGNAECTYNILPEHKVFENHSTGIVEIKKGDVDEISEIQDEEKICELGEVEKIYSTHTNDYVNNVFEKFDDNQVRNDEIINYFTSDNDGKSEISKNSNIEEISTNSFDGYAKTEKFSEKYNEIQLINDDKSSNGLVSENKDISEIQIEETYANIVDNTEEATLSEAHDEIQVIVNGEIDNQLISKLCNGCTVENNIDDDANLNAAKSKLKLENEIVPIMLHDEYMRENSSLNIEVVEYKSASDYPKDTSYQNEQHIVIKIEHESITNHLENVTSISTEDDLTQKDSTARQSITIQIEDKPAQNDETQSNSLESHEKKSEAITGTKPLYPITQAVREWMTKTRETTPEVEILKSPDTIYKEFIGNSDDDEEDSDCNQKNVKRNPSAVEYLDQGGIRHNSKGVRVAKSDSEDEVTVFETWSMSQDTSIQEDLLDCWEPDIMDEKKEDLTKRNEPIEEGEDVLEAYESKYGKNEDFLRLRAEIEEQRKNGTFPKHGNLPYRAICCSLM